MKATAALLREFKTPFQVEEIDINTDLQPEEVLVKVVATGLCHTDLMMKDGVAPLFIPIVLGHEGAGIVEKIGRNVTKVKVGDHVVLAPPSCSKCTYCKSGHPSYCENLSALNYGDGRRTDGTNPYHDNHGEDITGSFFGQSSFANYSLIAENNVVKVREDVPLEIMGPLSCGISTGAGTILNVLKPSPGESIAVFGVGPVGLAAIMAAKTAGCTTIVAVDIFDNRLELAKELGATHTINSSGKVVSEIINSEIMTGGLHYTFDTTGRNDVITQAVFSLRFLGKCVLVGGPTAPNLEINSMALMMGRSIQYVVVGDSVPDIFIPQLIELYVKGMFPIDKLVKFYDLKDINQAVEDSKKGIAIKAILKMPL